MSRAALTLEVHRKKPRVVKDIHTLRIFENFVLIPTTKTDRPTDYNQWRLKRLKMKSNPPLVFCKFPANTGGRETRLPAGDLRTWASRWKSSGIDEHYVFNLALVDLIKVSIIIAMGNRELRFPPSRSFFSRPNGIALRCVCTIYYYNYSTYYRPPRLPVHYHLKPWRPFRWVKTIFCKGLEIIHWLRSLC